MMSIIKLIVVIILIVQSCLGDSQTDALIDFFNSTAGNRWKKNDYWGTNEDPCGLQKGNSPWYGLVCSGGWVSKISMSNNAIGGTIPPSIVNITYLSSLDLSDNMLVGPLPQTIVDMTSLAGLFLGGNQLTGKIPNFGDNSSSLVNLFLHSNHFSGGIPNSFMNLTTLQQLDLSSNSLSGSVPEWLSDLPLNSLWIDYNNFSGQMPLSVCQRLILCSAAFNAHLMCPSMSCTCGAMQSCNCNNMCQNDANCAGGLCSTCVGASPYQNGYCQSN